MSACLRTILAVLTVALPSAAPGADPPAFPTDALLPKKETGADRFLAKHRAYDGRGVVVAIFDTGVDPGAPGLQKTSHGKPKFVDIVDASGSGDVHTATIRELKDGTVESLSGRSLRPDPSWKNPSGEWRVGQKPGWEIFPGGLVTRLKKERREDFEGRQRQAVAAAKRVLEEWDADHEDPARDELEERRDLVARAEQLEEMMGNWEDPGPIYDCLVFHDGKKWRAAIDTDEDGDFEGEKALTNYRDELEWSTFGDDDLLNYVLNIYEEGDRLSIVADAGAHGTHVAGIVAAYFGEKSPMNGLAPGAQLVSVKIGDTRLGSTSVGTGDVRGFVASLENDVDVVNMSYGGPTRVPNAGRIEELRAEFVNEHGVIFVATAGNSGPALSSIGGPGGTSTATLGIGAVISPDMMTAQYSVRESNAEQAYHWSSRGPVADGFLGVDFCAPGGAFSPVPNWGLQGTTLMNGTSMAAPSVAGGIALLLSGLKQEDLEYSPQSVRRALANTARSLDGTDPWGQGPGVVQIDAAWEHLKQHAARDDRDVRYEISIASRAGARGIYLREPFENDRPFEGSVTVDPLFPEDADNRAKVEFEKRILLRSTADWIDVADTIFLPHGGRRVVVNVDPRGLAAGAHYAEIEGIDAAASAYGPLFTIPVTVIRPLPVTEETDWSYRDSLRLRPGQAQRRFLAAPAGATWADIRIRRLDDGPERTIALQTVQLLEGEAYTDHGIRKYLEFAGGEEDLRSLEVTGERTLEVALVQHWTDLGESEVELEVAFHGLVPASSAVTMSSASGPSRAAVTSAFRLEAVEPQAELTALRKTLVPKESDVRPLDAQRDRLWEGRQIYELIARYEWEVAEAGKHFVRPAFAELPHVEDTFESAIWLVLDETGRRVAAGVGAEWRSVQIGKGRHEILLHVRHDDPDVLGNLRGGALNVDRVLGKPLSVQVRASSREDGEAFGHRDLLPRSRAVAWLSPPEPGDWPEGAEPGDVLRGSVTFGQARSELVGAGKRPGGWPLEVTLAPKPEEPSDEPEAADAEPEDDRTELEKLAEEVRDLKVERLAALGDEEDEAFETLAASILAEWPDHLPVLVAKLERVDAGDGERDPEAIATAADAVIGAVDQEALAAHFGVAIDEEDPAAKKQREEMEKERNALRGALLSKARAWCAAAGEKPGDEPRAESFRAAWTELEKWVDPEDEDWSGLRIEREMLEGRAGTALEILNGLLEGADEPKKDLHERRLEILEALGWDHWSESCRRELAVRFPATEIVF